MWESGAEGPSTRLAKHNIQTWGVFSIFSGLFMNPFTLDVCQLGVMDSVFIFTILPPLIISFVCNLFAVLLASVEYAVSGSFGSNTVKICHLELSLNLCRVFKVSDQIAFSLHSQFSLLTANHLAAPPLISCFPTCCCPAAERRTVNFVRVIVSVTHLIFPLGSCPL